MKKIKIKDKTFETYLTEGQIKRRIEELGIQISTDFEGEELVLLGVLNGSFVVMADLVRTISLPLSCEFIKIPASIEGRNVLVVEDIVDTGNSMAYLKKKLESLHPKRIAIATLLFKKEAFLFNYPLDYVGFEIPNKFVVGFGLDYDGEGRNYPDIYQLSIP
jgi:hypoxanthine phosphoribosyltransferase